MSKYTRIMRYGVAIIVAVTMSGLMTITAKNSTPQQNMQFNQAAAAEPEESYIIITVVEDQVITIGFRKGSGVYFSQFSVLLKGVTNVSQDYNIRHINSINFGGHTIALTLVVEPKDESS